MENLFDITYSSNLPELIEENNICILLSTYQAGKLIIISARNKEILQVPISFDKPMGIAIQENKLAVACQNKILFFSKNDKVKPFVNDKTDNFEAIFMQRASYYTGTLDVHDLSFGDGIMWGINTLFSCLSVFDINFSFRPKWKPEFVSHLVPEDRCHLNGMAMKDDIPTYVTSLSSDNEYQGWRKDKLNTGLLMRVPSGEVVLSNLAMPHSPRFYEQNLYLLESGKGTLIRYDEVSKTKILIYDFKCFVRGLAFYKDIAIIGKSLIRDTSIDFNDLPIKDGSKNAGLIFFDMKNFRMLGEINYTSEIKELFDVQILENTSSAVIVSNELEQYADIITFPGSAFKKNPTTNK